MVKGDKTAKNVSAIFVLILLAQFTGYIPRTDAVTPGNSISTALAISSGRVNATFSAAHHYYKINTQSGSLLSIMLEVPPGSDLDLTLYDPDSTSDDPKQLAESKTGGDGVKEFIEYRATKTGFYYIRVSGAKLSGTGVYAIATFVTDFRMLFAGFGTQDSQVEVAPGDLGTTLSLVVRNGADFAITDFVARITLPPQFSNSTSGNTLTQTLTSTTAAGQSATFSFLVNIAPSASIGKYALTVNFDYSMSSGLTKGVSVSVPITVSVTGKSIIRLLTDNQFLLPETTNDVTLKLRNEGTAPTSVIEFSLSVPSPLTLVGSDNKWTLAPLQPGQEVSILSKIFAPSSSKGQAFQLTSTATYKTAVGSTRTETRVVSIVVQAVGRGVISVVDTYWGSNNVQMLVAPGDRRVTLTITIQNLDNGPITGITQVLHLAPPFTNSTGGNTIRAFYPSAVQSGGSASTIFLLNVADNAQVRTYSLSMTVSYLDQRALMQTVDLNVPITIVGRSDIRINIPANVLLSGTANDVTVEIINSGTAPVYLANVAISFATSSPLSVVGGDAQRLINVIDAGARVAVPYKLYASSSTSEGLYAGSLSISYRDTNGQVVSETKSIGFVVKSWTSQITVKSNDAILQAGSLNNVALKIKNTGNQPISSITATISFTSSGGTSPLSLGSGSPQWTFGQIAANEEVAIDTQFFATLSSAGASYPVQLQISYLDANGYPHSETKSMSFAVKSWVSPIIVETQNNVLSAGSVNTILIKIKNRGNQAISSVQVTLLFPTTSGSTPLSLATGSATDSFTQIAANGEAEFRPQVFATLASADSSYQLQVEVIYTDNNGYQHTETKSFGISVRGKIILETQSLSVVPTDVVAGRNVTVVGNILNKGNVVAHYTEARVRSEGPVRTSPASVQYIGDVDPNTPVPFSVNFQVDRTGQAGKYPVTVQFVYEDQYGTKLASETKLEITVGQARQQVQQITQAAQETIPSDIARMLFIAGFTIIILAGLIIIRRSRRKETREVV